METSEDADNEFDGWNNSTVDADQKGSMLEEIRLKNREEINALLNSIRDIELEQEFAILNGKAKQHHREGVKVKKQKREPTFRWSGIIPINEIRKSSRLQNKIPQYKEEDLDGVSETLRSTYFKYPKYDLEFMNDEYKPKKRKFTSRKTEEHIIIPVEDVTEDMLNNIALNVKSKVYSANGTTCHQCRQKTLDQKTCCRNPQCSGLQGMLCGVCIKNRYGEDAAVALKNPNWHCFVCRGICNCSICRNRQGKRPTGILVPLCKQQGFESVKDFLMSLRGEGDLPDRDEEWALKRDDEALLGFSDNGKLMCFNNGKLEVMFCKCCLIKLYMDPENLLGFSNNGATAVYGNGLSEDLVKCLFC